MPASERPRPYITSGVFIGGAWRPPATGGTLAVVDPATEEIVASAPDSGPDDVDAAVRSAHAALPAWSGTPLERRIELVEALAAELLARSDEAMVTQTREMGAPVRLSRRGARLSR